MKYLILYALIFQTALFRNIFTKSDFDAIFFEHVNFKGLFTKIFA